MKLVFFRVMQSDFNRSSKDIYRRKSDKAILFYLQLVIGLKDSLARQT